MGDFHNVIIASITEQESGLVENVEQFVFHAPVFVLWTGEPTASGFSTLANGTIHIEHGRKMGHILYDSSGQPIEFHGDDYRRVNENLYKSLSFTRQPFRKDGQNWLYCPKLSISSRFSMFGEGQSSSYEEINYVSLFHILLPSMWYPFELESSNLEKSQGLLYAEKHLKIGRISLTFGFVRDFDLELEIGYGEAEFGAFDGRKYLQPTVRQRLGGVAKAAGKAVSANRMDLIDFIRKLVEEKILSGRWLS